MPDKNILDGIFLVQNGKIVAEPSVDNYQVHPSCAPGASEGRPAAGDPQAILRALKTKYPTCAFTWFSDSVDAASCRVSDPSNPSTPSEVSPPAADPPPAGRTRKPKQEPKS